MLKRVLAWLFSTVEPPRFESEEEEREALWWQANR
jgi:hypothetical protein